MRRVAVFAPGDLITPVETGQTDAQGKFVFSADRDGMWSAEARTPSEVARVMIRVGGPDSEQEHSRIPPIVVILGLLALLAMAWWYRVLRVRNRHAAKRATKAPPHRIPATAAGAAAPVRY